MNTPFIKRSGNPFSLASILISVILTLILFLVVGMPKNSTTVFLDDVAILGIVSLGQLIVMISGGIDFSQQGIYCASAILMSHIYMNSVLALNEIPSFVIFLILLAASTLIGIINGILIAKCNINPLIATFAVNALLEGILFAYTNGISGRSAPLAFEEFANRTVIGIPVILIFWLILVGLLSLFFKKTAGARILYATGNNRTSAYLSGINVCRVTILSYAVSGAFAGIAGMLACANNGFSTLSMADNVIFQTLLVALLAGASIFGGKGQVYQTVFGALTFTVIAYIFRLIPVHTGIQSIVFGFLLLILVTYSGWKSGAFQKKS